MNNPSPMPAAEREPLSVAATRTLAMAPAPRPLHTVIASELESLTWPVVIALSVFVVGVSIGLVRWGQDSETVSAGQTTRFSPARPELIGVSKLPKMRGHALPEPPMSRFAGTWEEQRGSDYEGGSPLESQTMAAQPQEQAPAVANEAPLAQPQQQSQQPGRLQQVGFTTERAGGGGGGMAMPAAGRQTAEVAAAPVAAAAVQRPAAAPAARPAPRRTLERRAGAVEVLKPAADKASDFRAEAAAPPDGSYKQPVLDGIRTQPHMAYAYYEGRGPHTDPKATNYDAWPSVQVK